MKSALFHILAAAGLVFVLSGCTGSMFVLTPHGERARIVLSNEVVLKAELLCLQEDALVVVVSSGGEALSLGEKEKIVGLPFSRIHAVSIEGYSNRRWVVPWIAFEVVPSLLLTVAAASVEGTNVMQGGMILGAFAALNGLVLYVSTPKPPEVTEFDQPEGLERLNLYTRFPQGLTPAELQQIMEKYDQQRYRVWDRDSVKVVSGHLDGS